MIDDREGTALSVSAGFVLDLTGEVDLDLGGFGGVTVSGSYFPEADDWVLDLYLFHRLNLLCGGSPGPALWSS